MAEDTVVKELRRFLCSYSKDPSCNLEQQERVGNLLALLSRIPEHMETEMEQHRDLLDASPTAVVKALEVLLIPAGMCGPGYLIVRACYWYLTGS